MELETENLGEEIIENSKLCEALLLDLFEQQPGKPFLFGIFSWSNEIMEITEGELAQKLTEEFKKDHPFAIFGDQIFAHFIVHETIKRIQKGLIKNVDNVITDIYNEVPRPEFTILKRMMELISHLKNSLQQYRSFSKQS